MPIRSISASLIFLLLSTPVFSDECSPQEPTLAELRNLLKENPGEIAQKESTLEKPRFFAVHGYAAQIVGIPSELADCAMSTGHSKPMPGTSDYLCTNEIVNLQPAANSFAIRHNTELAKLVKIKCP
jgi:hypothetical protein